MRKKAIATALGLSLACGLGPGRGAGATVDNNFGSSGRLTLSDVDNLGLAARAGGTIVGVGVLPYATKKIVVTERDHHGAPVATMGGDGTAELVVPGADGTAEDTARVFETKGVALAADGGVVVQFSTSVGASLAKITPNGTFDAGFGGGTGWVTDQYVLCGLATDLAIGDDGSIYTASHELQGNQLKPQCPGSGLRKYSAGGVKVDNWGGAARTVEGGRQDGRIEASAMAVGDVGGAERIVTVGVVPGNATASAGILLLDPAGEPVPGFGTDGLVTFDPSPGMAVEYWGGHGGFTRTHENKTATDVAIDRAGRIVVIGSSRHSVGGDIDVWVARLTPDGLLDPTFGTGGIAWTDVEANRDDYALHLALDGLDRPVITGSAASTPLGGAVDTRAQFTTRLTATGARDTTTLPTVTTFGTDTGHIPHGMALVGESRVYTSGSALDQYGLFRGYLGATTLPAVAATPSSTLFNGITPVRALDTRDGAGPVQAGSSRSVAVTGIGAIPAGGVAAVAVNITVETPTAGGYLTVWPSGSPMPLASSLNYGAGETMANAVVVGVGPDGRIELGLGDGSASVIVDVMGWFSAGNGFNAITPVRAADTRTGGGALVVPAGGSLDVAVTGLGGVPTGGVGAVAFNLTAVDPGAGGHLRAWPTGNATPYASVLNFRPGQTIANAMVLGTGTDGRVTIRNDSDGPVHLVVDVAGWFATGAAYHPVNPVRALDSRDGPAPFGSSTQRTLHVGGVGDVPATGVKAVVLNLTVTEPTNPTYVSVWPADGTRPTASAVNAGRDATAANALIVGVDANGDVELFNAVGDAHVIVDILGWF
ncbi:MAG: hypothetical protein IT196_09150 [Acidimicrobiales bacterium]|nr:hypothetical protein [Acidimicrobiales bacterium]